MSDCPTCGAIPCGTVDDIDLFSLQSETFPFVLNCPPGYDCTGLSSFNMLCCGQSIGEVFPNDATLEQRLEIIRRVVQRCFVAQLSCENVNEPVLLPPSGGSGGGGFRVYYSRPQAYTVFCPDGTPFTYSARAGLFASFSQEAADAAAMRFARAQAASLRICLRGIPGFICAGNETAIPIVATGGGLAEPPAMNYWQVESGSVPTGMLLGDGYLPGSSGSAAAILAGTPSAGGQYQFRVRVTGEAGATQSKEYSVCVVEITPDELPEVVEDEPYSQQLSVSACAGAAAWTIVSGTLPAGLTLSPDGLISGTPTEQPSGPITVRATIVVSEDGDTLDCEREISFAEPPPENEALAWWRMEEASGNRIDAINSVELEPTQDLSWAGPPPEGPYGPAFALVSGTSGKVGGAVELSGAQGDFFGGNFWVPFVDLHQVSGYSTTTSPGTGLSMILWVKYNTPMLVDYYAQWVLDSGRGLILRFSGSVIEVETGGSGNVSAPFSPDGNWHFVFCSYDPGTNTVKLSIDDGTVYSTGTVLPIPPGTSGSVTAYPGTGLPITGGGFAFSLDEWALFDAPLTPEQVTFFYNGGAGRTYPY
jgi:hypothetical protein